MNFCPNCGTKLDSGVSFCHNCGYKVSHNHNSYNTSNTSVTSQKSKFIAGILGLFLGTMGIHNFYLGYTGKAVVQLLMFVFWLGFFSFIWAIIDVVRIFCGNISTDANGNSLTDSF